MPRNSYVSAPNTLTTSEKLEAIKWVKEQYPGISSKDALEIVNRLNNKEVLTFDYYVLMSTPSFLHVENDPEEEELTFAEREKNWKRLKSLMEKGASGDAEAAIEFCQSVQNGEYFYPAAGC